MEYNKQIIINGEGYQLDLNEEEVELLKEFVQLVQEIKSEPILDKKFSMSLNISGSVNEPMRFDIKLPDGMRLSALLHKMRPLILKEERTYLHKIIKVFAKKIDNPLLRDYFKTHSKKFRIDPSYQAYHIRIDEKDIINEETFFLWLNAYEYHRDIDKIKKMEPIVDAFGKDFLTAIMINILIDKFHAIQDMANFVNEIIIQEKTQLELKRGE